MKPKGCGRTCAIIPARINPPQKAHVTFTKGGRKTTVMKGG